MMQAYSRIAALFTASLALVAGLGSAAAEPKPTVVELFTSQSCSSCPPADLLLGELAQRPEILALGFHVTYWNGTGWTDPLSRPQSTERQRGYARLLGSGQVYTPQLVIDGAREVIGSRRHEVFAALRAASHRAVAPVSLERDRGTVVVGAGSPAGGPASVLLLRFVQQRTTRVGAGENAARTLVDINAVEDIAEIGRWNGSELRFAIEPPALGKGLAVLVQGEDGTMLGAASLLGH